MLLLNIRVRAHVYVQLLLMWRECVSVFCVTVLLPLGLGGQVYNCFNCLINRAAIWCDAKTEKRLVLLPLHPIGPAFPPRLLRSLNCHRSYKVLYFMVSCRNYWKWKNITLELEDRCKG